MRSVALSKPPRGVLCDSLITKSQKRSRKKERINETLIFSAFQHFRVFSQQIYPLQVVKSDNMWSHIGQLERPLEMLIQNRYPIVDIVFANEVIAVKSFNGLCPIYKNWTNEFLCYANSRGCEIIRSIFFNIKRDELLIVCCSEDDDYTGLSAFAIKSIDLLRCRIDRKVKLFSEKPVKFPGFIEFDSPNGIAVFFSGKDSIYRIFSLSDYSEMYRLSSYNIQDIKLTPGSLILIKFDVANRVDFVFHDIEHGQKKGEYSINIASTGNVEFVERCGLTILIKQAGCPATIYDIQTNETRVIRGTESSNANDFAFLYSAKMFIFYKRGAFEVYTFEGLKTFTFTAKAGERLDRSPICVCPSQEYFICTSSTNRQRVYMFSLKDGSEVFCSEIDQRLLNGFAMTSIACDDESHCIVCGDEVGTSHFWL